MEGAQVSHARVVPAKMRAWNDDLETNVSRVIGYRVTDGDTHTGPIRSARQDAVADLAAYKAERTPAKDEHDAVV
jgi:hypothetical protein